MRYLLDTDWAVFSLRGRRDVAERIRALRGEGLAISTITLAELFTGVHRSKNPEQAAEGLRRFLRGVTLFHSLKKCRNGLAKRTRGS